MSYRTIADISESGTLMRRITAAAVQEGVENPQQWASDNRWEFAASPGWAAAWESYAVQAGGGDPGNNEAVITDGMILSAVQALNVPVP